MSSHAAQPRKGHPEVAERICTCVHKTEHHALKFRVDQPDMSVFDRASKIGWDKSAHGTHTEEIPQDAPKQLVQPCENWKQQWLSDLVWKQLWVVVEEQNCGKKTFLQWELHDQCSLLSVKGSQ